MLCNNDKSNTCINNDHDKALIKSVHYFINTVYIVIARNTLPVTHFTVRNYLHC